MVSILSLSSCAVVVHEPHSSQCFPLDDFEATKVLQPDVFSWFVVVIIMITDGQIVKKTKGVQNMLEFQ